MPPLSQHDEWYASRKMHQNIKDNDNAQRLN